jgi:hypothetical protein
VGDAGVEQAEADKYGEPGEGVEQPVPDGVDLQAVHRVGWVVLHADVVGVGTG